MSSSSSDTGDRLDNVRCVTLLLLPLVLRPYILKRCSLTITDFPKALVGVFLRVFWGSDSGVFKGILGF